METADGSFETEQSSELHRTLNRMEGPIDFLQLRKDIEAWRVKVPDLIILVRILNVNLQKALRQHREA